jgi:hypothetical protein
VFENRVLSSIFGLKTEKIGRKLQIKELHNLYSIKFYHYAQIKEDKMGGACSTRGEMKSA